MIQIVRPLYVGLYCLVVAGCQSASLEDAAPKALPVTSNNAGQTAVTVQADAAGGGEGSETAQTSSRTVRRNPGIASIIPIEKTTPVENKDFVTSGAQRSGQYPTFGEQRTTANAQFTDQDKLAAEAEITELLRNRATTPHARAQYEARLQELRALAASHGSDMQQEIEN